MFVDASGQIPYGLPTSFVLFVVQERRAADPMVDLWDDRCVQVIPNTGLRVDGKP